MTDKFLYVLPTNDITFRARRTVTVASVVPRVQCDDYSIPIPCPMNLAMDQYGYMVFRYVLFRGIAVPCRPSVQVQGGPCLDVPTRAQLGRERVNVDRHTQTIRLRQT